MTIGQEVRRRREAYGMSQSALSRASGVSKSWINKIENGDRVPSIAVLDKISKRLFCTTGELLNGREEVPDHADVAGSKSPVQPNQSK